MTTPVLQALLVADHIYQDQSTGKFVICGIFGTIYFLPPESQSQGDAAPPGPAGDESGGESGNGAGSGGPAGAGSNGPGAGSAPVPQQQQMPLNRLLRAGSPSAYVSLTEIHGQRSFELRYVDLNENHVLFTFEFKVECRNPLETIQLTLPLPVLPVPHEGAFALELVCEGELLGSHRVLAKRQPHQ